MSLVQACPSGWQFGEFEVERIGWRYRVIQRCTDGVVRDIYTGKFWRWRTAARIAQALMRESARVQSRAPIVISHGMDIAAKRRAMASMMGYSNDPATWPVATLDWLIDVERHRGNAWLMKEIRRLHATD